MLVAEFINHDTRQWNEALLTTVLDSATVEKVLYIPLAWEAPYAVVETLEHIFCDCPSIVGIWVDLHITWPSELSEACLQDWTSCARVVIRNSHWTVLALHMVVCKHILFAFAVEAIACLHTVHLGMALDFPDVIVEGDSLMVLHKVQSSRCDFWHFLRAGNIVADLLAKEGLKEGMGSYMCGVFPNLHNGRWSVIISSICEAFNGKWRGGGEHFS
ncbi:hypothetical protein Godav_011467 [Gossypium davidsonii]|uniref:RNase H type-1 domain-containing protein n=1 Tax=Gossypium davidsonii TaxID=34287 RepID=A0A7J8RA41_GOSDV|nr:hypothetical protein [Gossypium davidsonii]